VTERAKEILYYLLFIYLVWAGITAFIIYERIETMRFEAEYMANCIVMDQYGKCYTAEEYQELLKPKKIMTDELIKLLENNKPDEKFNEYFK